MSVHLDTKSELVTTKEVARDRKVSVPTLLDFYHRGIITADVAVGKTFRWDLERVRRELRDYSNRKGGAK